MKTKIYAGETPDEDGDDDGSAVPESGKLKKDGPPLEDYYLGPAHQAMSLFSPLIQRCPYFPADEAVGAASGHARLHTPPPDRH